MTPKVDIHEILRHVIENMENRVVFQSITDNGDGTYTIEACNTMWAMVGDIITVGNDEFTVTDVDPNVSMVVSGLVPFAPSVYFELKRPYYFHGTIRKTDNELKTITMGPEKFPMIYCFEIFRESYYQLKSDPRERTSSLRLFFLASADKNNWLTDTHYERAIKPLRNMVEAFIKYVDNRNGFSKLDEYETVNRVDFGTFTEDNGNLKHLFTDHLSGIELSIDLEVSKDLTCTLACPCDTPLPSPCPVATYKNSDGSFVIQIASATTYTSEDIDVTLNSGAFLTIPSNKDQDIELVDQTDTPIVPTSVVGNKITVTTGGGACNSLKPTKTGIVTSFRNYDDGFEQFGRDVGYNTLSWNNPFNNTNRFTDISGGQTYSDNIIIDWTSYDVSLGEVSGFYMTIHEPPATRVYNWSGWGTNAPFTIGSWSDWVQFNINQALSLINWSDSNFFDSAPFSYTLTSFPYVLSTSSPGTSSLNNMCLSINKVIQPRANTEVLTTILTRQFTLNELGL